MQVPSIHACSHAIHAAVLTGMLVDIEFLMETDRVTLPCLGYHGIGDGSHRILPQQVHPHIHVSQALLSEIPWETQTPWRFDVQIPKMTIRELIGANLVRRHRTRLNVPISVSSRYRNSKSLVLKVSFRGSANVTSVGMHLHWRLGELKRDGPNQANDPSRRTIVRDRVVDLVNDLQQEYRDCDAGNSYGAPQGWYWKTTFEQLSDDHWVLSSVDHTAQNPSGAVKTRLHFFASPFRIIATRPGLEPREKIPSFIAETGIQGTSISEEVIWRTADQAFSYNGDPEIDAINNVILRMHKPPPAHYLGFGEQGGKTVLKKPTYMNYFCYDNFNYRKVYGQGALDDKEPLYHSSPFFLEMNGTPNHRNVTGLMVDNYSQVAIDLGMNESNTIGIATRFGTFDAYIMTADNVPKMIWQYTSIVGRPKLKPRFILGHHQGCYGYSKSATVEGIVDGYRTSGIPLDGMHLDVDFQDRYRTFTASESNFGNISDFLNGLRQRGVKCCTNITPILSLRESDADPYINLRNFWDEGDKLNPATNLLVSDNRYLKGLPNNQPRGWRYDGANPDIQKIYTNSVDAPNNGLLDNYNFNENYNSGYPFHGGVSYGTFPGTNTNLGTPGYYPDLNRAVARERWGEHFPSRLLMSDDTPNQDPKVKPSTKTAIELWGLYSYNLHKATYNGLNKLKGRENKRNFVIGRGSLTGMHRFAGLWTGDNGSSWDFWRISVAQVIALGYSGMTIAGVDMGGFTPDPDKRLNPPQWCDPELLIHWYTGAFLLPWYRNHYIQHFGGKNFQEPWQYTYAFQNYPQALQGSGQDVYNLYMSVEPICRYYVQLRYSLMQVLYDTMFANLINGLPIARAMLITDPEDTTLFNANDDFIDNQYLLGHNILVCPVLNPGVNYRPVYLPGSDQWYPLNLRIDVQNQGKDPQRVKHAADLEQSVPGGTTISYGCYIPNAGFQPEQIPFVTPVYVRAGK
ncbi:hypothetical protein HER10_EVM0008029 [Colletotrichum scovillei]|uniref:uncharacterized protein n=1 Tax=Colletotrichum scovillei TaxID=1209932 RepID=UPI0015C35265|nr:uncharacterized protein HER10_EVM0008029 [Colletotrichum scovillei]KAF4781156.1 hypothetical protein HER10_EVM0008029 [Colletotrichum scovillei]